MTKLLPYLLALCLAACSKNNDSGPATLPGRWVCRKDSVTAFYGDSHVAGASLLGFHHYTRITPTAWVDSMYNGRTDRYTYSRHADTLSITPGFINYHDSPFNQRLRPARHTIMKLTAHELHIHNVEDTILPDGTKHRQVFDRYYRR
jgi:hypothetical protein